MHRFPRQPLALAAALAPLALLAACNSGPTVTATNASVAAVAAKAQKAIQLQPGEWSSKTELIEFDMPGMKDPGMAAMMKKGMAESAAKTITYCVTPEEAAKPSAEMFAGKQNGDCRFDTFTMSGGKMDSKMTCKAPDSDGTMVMTMNGNYTPTSYDATVAMNISAAPHGGMSMKAKTTATRIGACKPGQEKAS